MKKSLSMLLALAMLFSLCACSNNGTQAIDPSNSSQAITNNAETSIGSTEKPTDGTGGTTDATQPPTVEPPSVPTGETTTGPADESTTLPTQAPTVAPTTPPTTQPSVTVPPATQPPTTTPPQTEPPTTTAPTEPVDTTIHIADVSFSCSEYNLVKGSTTTIQTIIDPVNATETLTWESSDSGIATVRNGVVTAVGNGTAFITATAPNGDNAVCLVSVRTPVTGISLSQNSYTVYRNSSVSITAEVFPADASNKRLTWSSSDTSIVRVTNGTAVGISNGTATITVQTEDGGFSSQCTVTVVDAPLSLQCSLRHTTSIDGWKEGLYASVVVGGGNGNYSNYSFNITIYHNGNVVKSASNIAGNSFNSGWIAVLNVTLTEIKQYYHGGVGWDGWSGNYTAVFEVIDDSGNSHSGTATYSW